MFFNLQQIFFAFTCSIILINGASLTLAQEALLQEYVWYDPEKIVTAEPCGECHQSEYQAWEKTTHATGYKTLHRKKAAERIKKNMGFKLIKRESLCLKCHYLAGIKKGQLRAISGVSCESCHGAARDWSNVHNDYGKGFNYQTETAEHKEQRVAESKAKGMFRPSELYEVVANCFQCHTVPHEKLVNVGGHTTGSTDFEFLTRLDEIRHNFLEAQFDPTRTENAERSQERKRVMYVVGGAVDLEYSLRAVALAKEKGSYIRAMQRRVRSAVIELKAIANKVPLPEVKQMLTLVGQVNIKPNNEASLLNTAEKISEATQKFIKNNDGTQLASIDGLILGTEEAIVEAPPARSEGEVKVAETSDTPKPADVVKPGEQVKKAQPVYAEKQFIRPRSKHKTIGPSCDCHTEQNKWWGTDRHFSAIDPFANKSQKNVQIARLYGLSISEMTKGNRLCMDCHGTVITGEESEDVFDGVSCESCHGPASDYKRPHSAENPPNGYSAGKDFGMALLENLTARAEACAQCHYITDPRLISTGHPTGANFDFVRGNKKINHWKQPVASTSKLQSAYNKVQQKRGAIPRVTLASLSKPNSGAAATDTEITNRRTKSLAPNPPAIRPVDFQTSSPGRQHIELPPFPDIDDNTSVEEIILILKARLELLYKKIGQSK